MAGPNAQEVVSCRVARMVLLHARRSGWSMDALLCEQPYPLDHLDNPYAWITNDAMARLYAAAARLAGGEQHLAEISAAAAWEPLGPFRRLLEMLGDPGLAYALAPAWMVLFNRAATASVEFSGRGTCVLWGSYEASHPLQPLVDASVAGALAAIPEIFGLGRAEVKILESRARGRRQVVFRVTHPERAGSGVATRGLQRLIARPSVLAGVRSLLCEIDRELSRLAGARPPALAPHPITPTLQHGGLDHKLQRLRSQLETSPLVAAGLTARELEVAQHASVGQVNKEIAGSLRISEPTVKEHLSKVFAKLRVGNRTQLASLMLQLA